MVGSAINESSAVPRYPLVVLIKKKKLAYWILYSVQKIKWGSLESTCVGRCDKVNLISPSWSWVFTARSKFKPGEEENLCLPCGRGLWLFQVLSFPWQRHREPRGFVFAHGYIQLLALRGLCRRPKPFPSGLC